MLKVIDHPLIQHKIGKMRDVNTPMKEFRELCEEIALLLCFEATKDLPLEDKKINIWTGEKISVKRLAGEDIVLVPILRAGLGFFIGFEKLLPNSPMASIGIYRDESSLEPKKYHHKSCSNMKDRIAIILDPMLATGGSLDYAISHLQKEGCREIRVVCLVASEPGKERLEKKYPQIPIYAAALDKILDKNGYIRPGLGDAGDRLFGTSQKI